MIRENLGRVNKNLKDFSIYRLFMESILYYTIVWAKQSHITAVEMSVTIVQFQKKEQWSVRSLLDDKFALTKEQVEGVKGEGIPFLVLEVQFN